MQQSWYIIDIQETVFVYLIFDVYEQMCGAYTIKALQHDADREKLVESPHCRIVNYYRARLVRADDDKPMSI